MYRIDLFERLRTRGAAQASPRVRELSPAVWALGFTSLLTDISSEMVVSVLPTYLFLHLKLTPLQFGLIDGLYNGMAVAAVSLAAGIAADRYRRHKEIAFGGYALSALAKPALLAAGGSWTLIFAVVAVDRVGKGIRAAPRDAMISLAVAREHLGSAFGLHRALDTAGAMLGPLIAFAILAAVPGGFDVVWVASFAFAVLGCAVLALYVPRPDLPGARPAAKPDSSSPTSVAPDHATEAGPERRAECAARTATAEQPMSAERRRAFTLLALCGFALAATTVSDGFVFLLLHEGGGLPVSAFPLYYVAVAAVFVLAAIPAGALADRVGRGKVLLAGYALLCAAYALLAAAGDSGPVAQVAIVLLMGLYYACTEGVLLAMASSLLGPGQRARGLAWMATSIGLGKAASSVAFGAVLGTGGALVALVGFTVALGGAMMATLVVVRSVGR